MSAIAGCATKNAAPPDASAKPEGRLANLGGYHLKITTDSAEAAYAGLAAPYVIADADELSMFGPFPGFDITGSVVPGQVPGIPLVLQDKSFKAEADRWGNRGDLDYPTDYGPQESFPPGVTKWQPGDEVVIFEPFYENYGPDAKLSGAIPRLVALRPPEWTFDPDELRRAFGPRTKAIILNSPNNPTGKVFTREELTQIAELCREFDALAITDEIYEHIVYDGACHVPIMTLPGMRERSILVNSMSKTYSVTGWRVGWVLAPPALTDSIRKVHDFLTVGAAAPLQQAGAVALSLPDAYYETLARDYSARRDFILPLLESAGFRCFRPRGAYYVMTDISTFGFPDDVTFVRHLIRHAGVAAVPGSSFFQDPRDGSRMIRFCFCKKRGTLEAAGARLSKL